MQLSKGSMPTGANSQEAATTEAAYHVAELPREDVEKLQRLEEELRADTGEEVVVIAYEKERSSRHEPPSPE